MQIKETEILKKPSQNPLNEDFVTLHIYKMYSGTIEYT